MKGKWLSCMVLCVSAMLLLTGGVALAKGLYVAVEKPCVACFEEWPPQDENIQSFTLGGFNPSLLIWERIIINGTIYAGPYGTVPPPEDPSSNIEAFPCDWSQIDLAPPFAGNSRALVTGAPPGPLGEWVIRVWQESPPGTIIDSAEARFVVAEDCSAYEFVPEPSSLILLGGGLAGLVGYATHRLRSGESLRWSARR